VELCAQLRQREIHPQAAVLNAVTPARFTDGDLAALRQHPRLWALAKEHRALSDASSQSLEKLKNDLRLPVISVPRLSDARFGREAVEKIASALEPELKANR
jgi:hypothetical protein